MPGEHLQGGISDGERKLLSIAIELVGVPPVLCLDAPLTGLDTASTTRVADVLRSLAHQHMKTILCSVNQPSNLILSFCDNILLLSHGEVAYAGSISDLNEYLHSVDSGMLEAERRSFWSPIECALDRLSHPEAASAYTSAWGRGHGGDTVTSTDQTNPLSPSTATLPTLPPLSPLPPSLAAASSLPPTPFLSSETSSSSTHPVLTPAFFRLRHPAYENTFSEQLLIFIQRHAHYKLISTSGGVKTILGRFLITGVLFGLTFRNVGQKVEDLNLIYNFQEEHLYAAVYNLMGLMFCYSVFVTVSNFLPIPSLFDMRRLYELEMVSMLVC
jgi:hypothetical protein